METIFIDVNSFSYFAVTVTLNDWNVDFFVHGTFNVEEAKLSEKEGKALVRQAIKVWKEWIATLPSGTELVCRPYNGDGKGKKRAKLYTRMGFTTKRGKQYRLCI
jgi:hypothetical protein